MHASADYKFLRTNNLKTKYLCLFVQPLTVYISCHIGSHKIKGTDSGIYHVPRHLSKLWLISPTCNISHITLIGQSYTQFVVRFHRSKTATITAMEAFHLMAFHSDKPSNMQNCLLYVLYFQQF